ncbi:MAG: cyclic-phosphate processing receiver domain-containing protein [Phycisphaerae bacterium]
MKRVVLILEDDAGRVGRFVETVGRVLPGVEVVCWGSAREMVREVAGYLDRAVLISLDHDLYAPGEEDVGDGLEVARFLAEQGVRCPVVIHSSNAERSGWMRGVLEVEGWGVRMVVPVGERGVEEDWGEVVRGLVAG